MAPPLRNVTVHEIAGTAFAKTRPILFHATALGAWESIAESGLRPAADLAAQAGISSLVVARDRSLTVELPAGQAVLRDQLPIMGPKMAPALDGVTLEDWLAILNSRIFLFAQTRDLDVLLKTYRAVGQDVLTLRTSAVLQAAAGRIEVTTVNSGALPRTGGPSRGRGTFIPWASWSGTPGQIHEVTIVGGLDDVSSLVRRVDRYHPDGRVEQVR